MHTDQYRLSWWLMCSQSENIDATIFILTFLQAKWNYVGSVPAHKYSICFLHEVFCVYNEYTTLVSFKRHCSILHTLLITSRTISPSPYEINSILGHVIHCSSLTWSWSVTNNQQVVIVIIDIGLCEFRTTSFITGKILRVCVCGISHRACNNLPY
jgi:hypothetical protein